MKNQAFFSSKGTSKKLKCRLLHFLFGALKVNMINHKLSHYQAGTQTMTAISIPVIGLNLLYIQ